ncbi:MAG: hypothetical protein LBP73_00770, partial [Clostridiales Family XIII bacterium]|nr:hypothetical protein [Clostridiales Family XIII bacterium]
GYIVHAFRPFSNTFLHWFFNPDGRFRKSPPGVALTFATDPQVLFARTLCRSVLPFKGSKRFKPRDVLPAPGRRAGTGVRIGFCRHICSAFLANLLLNNELAHIINNRSYYHSEQGLNDALEMR